MKDKEKLDQLLNFDSLDAAEKLTGQDYHQSEETSGLGFLLHLQKNQKLKKMLIERDDSYFGITFDEMFDLAKRLDFVEVYREKFQGRGSSDKDTLILMWNAVGILLRIESYGNSLNTANIHFNLKFNNEDQEKAFFELGHISGHYNNDHKCWVGTLDVREAFRYYYESYLKVGEFIPTWIESPYLNISSHIDYDPPYELMNRVTCIIPDKLSLQRLLRLPLNIQECIQVAIIEYKNRIDEKQTKELK